MNDLLGCFFSIVPFDLDHSFSSKVLAMQAEGGPSAFTPLRQNITNYFSLQGMKPILEGKEQVSKD